MVTTEKELTTTNSIAKGADDESSTNSVLERDVKRVSSEEIRTHVKSKNKKVSELKLIDPDEVVDPVTLSYDSGSDKDDDDNGSENSDASSDSSLEPYDLLDDDTDLKRNFTQLVDVVGALRKSDNADGVSHQISLVNLSRSVQSNGFLNLIQ